MKTTAAALLLVTVPTLAGAAVVQNSATAAVTTHTKHYVLKETASHEVGKYDFTGTDRIRAAGTGRWSASTASRGTSTPSRTA